MFTLESLPCLQISNTSPGALKAALVDTARTHVHTALTKGRNDGDRLPGCAGSAVSAISCMTADKLFNFFVPQFPDLRYGVAIVPNCKAVPRIM